MNLRIDATYFKRFCLVCYQDKKDGYTQLIRFSSGEHYEEMREDLDNLLRLGVQLDKDYLNEKTFHRKTGRYWYTHKLLRRSYQTIKRAMPNMFYYLVNPKIPATTNGIEGYFSHLKYHLDIHRGLSLRHYC